MPPYGPLFRESDRFFVVTGNQPLKPASLGGFHFSDGRIILFKTNLNPVAGTPHKKSKIKVNLILKGYFEGFNNYLYYQDMECFYVPSRRKPQSLPPQGASALMDTGNGWNRPFSFAVASRVYRRRLGWPLPLHGALPQKLALPRYCGDWHTENGLRGL